MGNNYLKLTKPMRTFKSMILTCETEASGDPSSIG